MRRKILALGVTAFAVAAVVLTAMPWAVLDDAGVPFSWNGFGHGTYRYENGPTVDVASTTPLGIWIVIACVAALVSAVALLVPALSRLVAPVCRVTALITLTAGLLALAVIVRPAIFLDSGFSDLGMRPLLGVAREFLQLSTIVGVSALMLATAAGAAAAAVTTNR